MTMGIIRNFINYNIKVCDWMDSQIFHPNSLFRTDGRQAAGAIINNLVKDGDSVCDVGGGKNPFFTPEIKKAKSLFIAGLDISEAELNAAPVNSYDAKVNSSIEAAESHVKFDLVICLAVLEHVVDVAGAVRSISQMLAHEGKCVLFVPSRNAVFARLNKAIPEGLKRSLLFYCFPEASSDAGFPSFYNKCTPRELTQIAEKEGMILLESHFYYSSGYFRVCAPIYVLWRIWIVLFRYFRREQAAETFTLIFSKK